MIKAIKSPIVPPDDEKIKVWAMGQEASLVATVVRNRIALLQVEASNAALEKAIHGQELQALTVEESISEIRSLQGFLDVLDKLGKKPEFLNLYRLEVI